MVSIRTSALPCLISALLLARPTPAQSAERQFDAQGFLEIVARKSTEGFQADYEETRILPLFAEPIRETGKIEFQPPFLFRKEALTPHPSLTLSDGQTLWLLFPGEKEGEAYPLARSPRLREAITALIACLDAFRIPKTFHVEGRTAPDGTHLTLTPKTSALRSIFSKATMVFDNQPRLKSLTLEAVDGATSTLRFSQHRKPASPSQNFQPSAGYTITYPLGK